MDRRLKNGLAWAGVVLVCAIPAADWVTQQFSAPVAANVSAPAQEAAAAPAPAAKPAVVETASAEPVAPAPAPKPRKMPSYISDAGADETIEDIATTTPAKPAVTPKPQAPVAKPETVAVETPRVVPGATPPANDIAATEPKVVITPPADRTTNNVPAPVRDVANATLPAGATFRPEIVAPIPMPASMRPTTRPVDPVRTGNVTPNSAIVPVNGAGYGPDEPISRDDIITAEDLEDWESGPLSEFLAQRQNQAGNSAPRSRYAPVEENDYDPNGFFLSDGPNADRRPPANIIYPYGGY